MILVPPHKLVTPTDSPTKGGLESAGFSVFGLPIVDSPHARFLRGESTDYVEIVDHVCAAFPDYFHQDTAILDGKTRARQFLQLLDSIKKDGIREPALVFARDDGRFEICGDGTHRAACASVLGMDVPCEVKLRGKLVREVEDLLTASHPRGERVLYDEVGYEFFQQWPVLREKRSDMILQSREWRGLSVLDIGCNTGTMSLALSLRGAKVVGIDIERSYVRICQILGILQGSAAQFRLGAFESIEGQFDCVLFLSVLHWYMRRGISAAAEALNKVSALAPLCYFDSGQANEEKMKTWTELDVSVSALQDFVLANSSWTRARDLGRVGNRNLLVFER